MVADRRAAPPDLEEFVCSTTASTKSSSTTSPVSLANRLAIKVRNMFRVLFGCLLLYCVATLVHPTVADVASELLLTGSLVRECPATTESSPEPLLSPEKLL